MGGDLSLRMLSAILHGNAISVCCLPSVPKEKNISMYPKEQMAMHISTLFHPNGTKEEICVDLKCINQF